MIIKDEIESKAVALEVNTSDIQRDYVFGWVLNGIYTISELGNHLILKGGNCLRKAYFENTRYSNDLDFAVETMLSEEFIRIELNKVCSFVNDMAGVTFETERTRVGEKKRVDSSKQVYEARIYFKDFYGNESRIIIGIRLDITQFDKIFLPIQTRRIIHNYSDYKECNTEIKVLKLEEVLASKLKCLLQRRHSCDLYDYLHSFLFSHNLNIDKLEIVSTLLKMTIFQRSPGILKGLLIELPFQIIKGLWDKYLVCPKLSNLNFDNAVEIYKSHIAELFGNLPVGRGHQEFFPAKYRNMILEAGSKMVIMDVVYDGYRRKIEPYTLTYKTRKDGESSEYFYVYDLTGGESGKTGIKMLVHSKISELNLTNDKFEPRFEVELSKMGEHHKKSYFAQPFSNKNAFGVQPRQKTTSIRRIKTGWSAPMHLYQCSVCGKKFKRKDYNSNLNAHKDKYGNQCYGSYGTYLGMH